MYAVAVWMTFALMAIVYTCVEHVGMKSAIAAVHLAVAAECSLQTTKTSLSAHAQSSEAIRQAKHMDVTLHINRYTKRTFMQHHGLHLFQMASTILISTHTDLIYSL